MTDVEKLTAMSRYAGGRYDLVQGSGGNASVKLSNNRMLIKSSGFLLSEVADNKGITAVDNIKILSILQNTKFLEMSNRKERDSIISSELNKCIIEGSRPSIETFFHSVLYKFTLHIHPLTVSIVTCSDGCENILKTLFSDALSIAYRTPGIESAFLLKDSLSTYIAQHGKKPKLFFLQNHGLIVSSDDFQEIEELTEMIVKKIEAYLHIDFLRYKITARIAELTGQNFSWLSEDKEICHIIQGKKELLFIPPFFPDKMVFCGASIVEIKDLDDKVSVYGYQRKYHELPKVVLYRGNLYFAASTLKKAKEMEEIFKFHLLSAERAVSNINFLSDDEAAYLGNWEPEKYRQLL